MDRNVGFHRQQHRSRITRHIQRAGAVDFFNLLTGPELLEMTERHLPEHRERLYPPTVALSMFMKQSLEQAEALARIGPILLAKMNPSRRLPSGLPAGASLSQML